MPDYGALVIDEAHHLEDVATDCLARSVAKSDLERWLFHLTPILRRSGGILPLLHDWGTIETKINTTADAVRTALGEFYFFVDSLLPSRYIREVGAGMPTMCLTERNKHLLMSGEGGFYYQVLVEKLRVLLQICNYLLQLVETWEGPWVHEFGLWVQEGRVLLDTLIGIVANEDPNWVQWVEGKFWGGCLCGVLKAAPIAVDESLYMALFDASRGTVITSATLTTEGRFDHFANIIGINRLSTEALKLKRIDSPFDYKEKTALLVVKDLPLPQEVSPEDYFAVVANALSRLLLAAQERTLVLFTANHMLREVTVLLKQRLMKEDVMVLVQGVDGARTRLVGELQQAPRSVLCGTASFWEGIDLPGVLRMVVIIKLPFPPYEAPVISARRANLQKKGQNDFQALSLPYAILRFKQGFGRLIRSCQDSGVVVVLDRRLVERKYGYSFIRSLPSLPVEAMLLDKACEYLKRCFGKEA